MNLLNKFAKKRKFLKKQDIKNQTLASITNTIKILKKEKKNCNYNINKIICYDYNKKDHYTNIYIKLLKN